MGYVTSELFIDLQEESETVHVKELERLNIRLLLHYRTAEDMTLTSSLSMTPSRSSGACYIIVLFVSCRRHRDADPLLSPSGSHDGLSIFCICNYSQKTARTWISYFSDQSWLGISSFICQHLASQVPPPSACASQKRWREASGKAPPPKWPRVLF